MASWRLLRRQFLACLLAGFVGQSFVTGAHRQVAPPPRSVPGNLLTLLLAVRDPWAVLELTPGASRDEVKKAFREKIRKAHPDAGGTAKEFKEVRDAYQAALNEDFYRWRREQVNKQKVEWDQDATGAGHWWSSAEQRAEQKEQARAMDEEPQPRGRPRNGAGGRSERRTEKRAKERRTRSSRERFEDDSVREWNDFLSKQGQSPVKERASVATRAARRSEKIKDPVVTHRSIATMEGDVRVPVFRSRSGRCYYVSPLTNREVTVPS